MKSGKKTSKKPKKVTFSPIVEEIEIPPESELEPKEDETKEPEKPTETEKEQDSDEIDRQIPGPMPTGDYVQIEPVQSQGTFSNRKGPVYLHEKDQQEMCDYTFSAVRNNPFSSLEESTLNGRDLFLQIRDNRVKVDEKQTFDMMMYRQFRGGDIPLEDRPNIVFSDETDKSELKINYNNELRDYRHLSKIIYKPDVEKKQEMANKLGEDKSEIRKKIGENENSFEARLQTELDVR